MCKCTAISEFWQYETGKVSAAACTGHGAAWRCSWCLSPGHEESLQQAAGATAKLLCPPKNSPGLTWKSNCYLMSHFPTQCIWHFQCLSPKNSWISVCESFRFASVISSSGSPHSSFPSLSACTVAILQSRHAFGTFSSSERPKSSLNFQCDLVQKQWKKDEKKGNSQQPPECGASPWTIPEIINTIGTEWLWWGLEVWISSDFSGQGEHLLSHVKAH